MFSKTMLMGCFLLLSGLAVAEDAVSPVFVGDPAPPIPDLRWVGGESVTEWSPGHVYVVDFWATWCPPCIEGLRRLQKLHERVVESDVHVIAVAIWSARGPTTPEEVLAQFPELSYSLAIDIGDNAAAFMEKTRSSGLPNTMIVDRQGRLAWVGNPSTGLEESLDAIVAGTYDIDTVRQADVVRHRAGVLIGQASRAERNGDFRSALELIDRAIAVDPDRFSVYRGWQYEIAAVRLADGAEAQRIADEFLAGPQGDDPYPLFVLATRIVMNYEETPHDLRDLELALRCATGAVDNDPDPEYDSLALLAQVHALRGEFSHAAQVQIRAVEVAPESAVSSAAKQLQEYRAQVAAP